MKNKSSIVVIAALTALAIAIGVLVLLGREDIQARQQQLADGVLLIVYDDITHEITVEDIEALGPQAFDANYNRSGRPAENRVFYGVRFAQVFDLLEIDSTESYTVVFAAADGYASALPMAQALGDAYLVLCGELGPFRMVLPHDPVSQRWVHWLTDVTIS